MKILRIHPDPLIALPSVHCAPGGRGVVHKDLPVLHGEVDALPDALDALIVASDLQCYDSASKPAQLRRLMGYVLAEQLGELAEGGALPDPSRTGVILAGDLYAIPTLDKRGGAGDVQEIWAAFEDRFKWVAGVGGNHDLFYGRADLEDFPPRPTRAPMHGDIVEVDGLTLGGISGVVGRNRKSWRVKSKRWQKMAARILRAQPDVFVLHQGPAHPAEGLPGHRVVNEGLVHAQDPPPLVICGHAHWDVPHAVLISGVHVLNVDYRCVVLTRAGVELGGKEAM